MFQRIFYCLIWSQGNFHKERFFLFFCDELGIEYPESTMTERSRDSESYFLAMFKWYTKYPNIDHNSKLRDILSNLQRQDIIESLTDFKKISFQQFQIHDYRQRHRFCL